MNNDASLRGFVEKVQYGDGFLFVSGWAANAEKGALEGALLLRLDGVADVVISKLAYRGDLDKANIAGGYGGFACCVMTDRVFEETPQVFARQKSTQEVLLSGPGTEFSAFKPLGALDRVGPSGVVGWLYDPGAGGAVDSSSIVIDNTVRLPLGKRVSRIDLPFDAGTPQRFGFFVSNEEIESAFEAMSLPYDVDGHNYQLISSGKKVARVGFVEERVSAKLASTDKPAETAFADAVNVSPGGERTVAAPAESKSGAVMAGQSGGPTIVAVSVGLPNAVSNLTLRVEKLSRGNGILVISGWAARSDNSAIDQPLLLALDGIVEVAVLELDSRADIAKKGIAGGRAAFIAAFAWPEDLGDPTKVTALTQDRLEFGTQVLDYKRITRPTSFQTMKMFGANLQGTYFNAMERAKDVNLIVEDKFVFQAPLDKLASAERVWSEGGQFPNGFSLRSRDILSRLRARQPDRFFSNKEKTRISILNGAGDVLLSGDFRLLWPANGRLEAITPSRVNGWVVSSEESKPPVDFDVYVNGHRYLTERADITRSDLVKKGISPKGGGFRFEPSNPDPASKTIEIKVAQAYTDNFLAGKSESLELESAAQPDLQRLYSILNVSDERRTTVIIPIYNAADDLELCLESLLKNTSDNARLLLIDDCSPDPKVVQVLDRYKHLPNLRVLSNIVNLGFTKTVNRGIREAGSDDVVLLNSDTIVSPQWLQGLKAAAYSGPRVATATAVSNNSGVFSVPEINVDNAFPADWNVDDFGRLVRQASIASYPRAPTGNGFCMFVRRDCLDAIGPLDEVAFPVGYGEENDFCMRALRAGYEHVCDDRTFVYHKRSASFGTSKSEHYARGRETVRTRYPEYQKITGVFERGNRFLGMRWRIRKALSEHVSKGSKPKPRIAYVISTQTGGTPQTNRDLMTALSDRYEPWVIRCDSRKIEVYTFDGEKESLFLVRELRDRIVPTNHRSSEYDEKIIEILVAYGFELVHIRHLGWHGSNLPALCKRLGIPAILSLHDFYTVCPTIKLLDENQKYCAGRCTDTGGDCKVELWEPGQFPTLKHNFIKRWRELFQASFESCSAFVTTSERAKGVFLDAFPQHLNRDFKVIPHGRSFSDPAVLSAPVSSAEPLRVLVPGNISPAKGADLIREILDIDMGKNVEFHILGDGGRLTAREGLILHGLYKRDEFATFVKEIKPHIGAVFSVWPETYCHTLTEMWSCGVPVVGVDVGAVGERILHHGGGWLVPLGVNASSALEKLLEIRADTSGAQQKVDEVLEWQSGYGKAYTVEYMAMKYDRLYREVWSKQASFNEAGQSPVTTEVVVIGGTNGAKELTENHIGARAIFWKPSDAWRALGGKDAISIDAILVNSSELSPGDGAKIAELAKLKAARIGVLWNFNGNEVKSEFWNASGFADLEDEVLLKSASVVFLRGDEDLSWIKLSAGTTVQRGIDQSSLSKLI